MPYDGMLQSSGVYVGQHPSSLGDEERARPGDWASRRAQLIYTYVWLYFLHCPCVLRGDGAPSVDMSPDSDLAITKHEVPVSRFLPFPIAESGRTRLSRALQSPRASPQGVQTAEMQAYPRPRLA